MAPKNRKPWNFISDFCQELLLTLYYNFGLTVYRHPIRYCIVGIITTLLCSIGLLNYSYNTDAVDLYIPHSSTIYKHSITFFDYFGEGNDNMNLIIKEKNGNNLLTPTNMDIIFQIFKQTVNVTNTYNGVEYSFTDLCARPYPSYPNCESFESGLLGLFQFNPNLWSNQSSIQKILDQNSAVLFVK